MIENEIIKDENNKKQVEFDCYLIFDAFQNKLKTNLLSFDFIVSYKL